MSAFPEATALVASCHVLPTVGASSSLLIAPPLRLRVTLPPPGPPSRSAGLRPGPASASWKQLAADSQEPDDGRAADGGVYQGHSPAQAGAESGQAR